MYIIGKSMMNINIYLMDKKNYRNFSFSNNGWFVDNLSLLSNKLMDGIR